MKSVAVVRKIDNLGRIVLPKEFRKMLCIAENEDSLEIFVDGDSVIFKRYTPSCTFCNNIDVTFYKNRSVCKTCLKEITTLD